MDLPPASIAKDKHRVATRPSLPMWDQQLIAKYDVPGPRYTSYPTAVQFAGDYDLEVYRQEARDNLQQTIAPLSLYVHIPFCQNICYYCACNKVVTSDPSAARTYLDYLTQEIELQSPMVDKHRTVMQLHLGGGTPTFFDGAELTELMHVLASHYKLTDSERREYSIEIDPRTVTKDSLALLKGLGFNRLSLGVQDFDEQVQQAINRRQRYGMIKILTETARLYQFKSISYDLIYGLPMQTLETLSVTLDKTIALSPDRIAFYSYAHLPKRFKSQRAIDRLDLPSAVEKLEMLSLITEKLLAAGYVHIGMDHFVKPKDDLALARHEGKLQRNFQGYSTCMAPDLVGLGVSSISAMQSSYAQNERALDDYYQRLDAGILPIAKGFKLSEDDQIRRAVINRIICDLQLDTQTVEKQFGIIFSEYFSQELLALKPLQSDGLLCWHGDKLTVSELGQLMLRNICMVFDKYLRRANDNSSGREQSESIRFSNTL
ncbi:oxygen-independent coproporphyrinogen III oxidase [Oceanicoccus sp.]|uniref:oxygen-independent coproporphyrinogen III oxidase n=1 Tax=Oceanicoccus sp. TaxID=2691044 RepID=UPI00263085C4|nr:oxygen-independent coproporphyrinogen III oxidase [Oceanicoccus sp.]